MLRACAVFFILFFVLAINMPHGLVVRLGLGENYLLAALVAAILSGLTMRRRPFVIALVILCCVFVNMPIEIINNMGFNKDYFLAALLGMVLVPVGKVLSDKR
jgi:hypothetical protein